MEIHQEHTLTYLHDILHWPPTQTQVASCSPWHLPPSPPQSALVVQVLPGGWEGAGSTDIQSYMNQIRNIHHLLFIYNNFSNIKLQGLVQKNKQFYQGTFPLTFRSETDVFKSLHNDNFSLSPHLDSFGLFLDVEFANISHLHVLFPNVI